MSGAHDARMESREEALQRIQWSRESLQAIIGRMLASGLDSDTAVLLNRIECRLELVEEHIRGEQ